VIFPSKTVDSKGDKNYSVVTVRVSRELHSAAKRKLAGMDDGFQGLLNAFLAAWVGDETQGQRTPMPARSEICKIPAHKRAEIIDFLGMISADLATLPERREIRVELPERSRAAG
jgi:hypothetical protein